MRPTDELPDLLVRPALDADASQIAAVHVLARRRAPMPAPVHTDAAVETWIADRVGEDDVWVAEAGDGVVVGYARWVGAWLDDLYVHPDHQGEGIGSTLLDLVKAQRPGGFCLWVFARNHPARRFYRRHGLVELEETDGSANEERAPDVRMAWAGAEPLTFLRGLVDEVDDQLGDLLARRVALTRVIQDVKHDASRDRARERDIARRLAVRAPELGEERLARIVDAVVTASLDTLDRGP